MCGRSEEEGVNASTRYVFDLAGPDDAPELLEILEATPMPGWVRLVYTRRPDAWASIQHEGEDVRVVVLRDQKRRKIAGFGVCALRRVWREGKPDTVGYLFGLRARPEYRRRLPLLHRGYAYLRASVPEHVRVFYTTILEENVYARRLLERRRAGMPAYRFLGRYVVHALVGRPGAKPRLEVQPLDPSWSRWLRRRLEKEARRWDLFPVLEDPWKFRNEPVVWYGVFRHGQPVGAFTLRDLTRWKQYRVVGYHPLIRFIQPLSRWFPRFGLPYLPPPGNPLPLTALSWTLIPGQDPEIFLSMLDHALSRVSLLVVGLMEGHPLGSVLARYRRLSYRSRVYQVIWEDAPPLSPERLHLDVAEL